MTDRKHTLLNELMDVIWQRSSQQKVFQIVVICEPAEW